MIERLLTHEELVELGRRLHTELTAGDRRTWTNLEMHAYHRFMAVAELKGDEMDVRMTDHGLMAKLTAGEMKKLRDVIGIMAALAALGGPRRKDLEAVVESLRDIKDWLDGTTVTRRRKASPSPMDGDN